MIWAPQQDIKKIKLVLLAINIGFILAIAIHGYRANSIARIPNPRPEELYTLLAIELRVRSQNGWVPMIWQNMPQRPLARVNVSEEEHTKVFQENIKSPGLGGWVGRAAVAREGGGAGLVQINRRRVVCGTF